MSAALAIGARLRQIGFDDHFWAPQLLLDGEFVRPDLMSPSHIMAWLRRQCDFAITSVSTRSPEPPYRSRILRYQDAVKALAAGRSIQIRHLEKYLASQDELIQILTALQEETQLPVESLSLFLTPGGQQALPVHHDDVRVVTIQLHGTKNWELWPANTAIPAVRHEMSEAANRVSVSAGGLLYVPTNIPHRVVADRGDSVSVGFIFREFTLKDIVLELLERPEMETHLARRFPNLSRTQTNMDVSELWKALTRQLSDVPTEVIMEALQRLVASEMGV